MIQNLMVLGTQAKHEIEWSQTYHKTTLVNVTKRIKNQKIKIQLRKVMAGEQYPDLSSAQHLLWDWCQPQHNKMLANNCVIYPWTLISF